MGMLRFLVRPASSSDAITNSSTELFAVNGFGTADDVLSILDDLWEEYRLDFPDDPDFQYVGSMKGASAFMPNDEYIARWAYTGPGGETAVLPGTFSTALRPGVVVLELPMNTPDRFVEKVARHFNAPSETVG